MSETPTRRVVFVAGSGRSGTSTISGILKTLGMYVPQPEVEADESNPRGFGEPQWVVDFHTRLLEQADVQVSDARPTAWLEAGRVSFAEEVRTELADWLEGQFQISDEVVIKDPRLAWFLELWQAAAMRCDARVGCAIMLRPPTEVADSKRAYYGRTQPVSIIAGWLNMMLHTERATRGLPRTFIRYHDLLDDWTVPVSRVGELFDLVAVKGATPTQMNEVHQFVDPNLRRIKAEWSGLDVPDRLRELADQVWERLTQLADAEGTTPATEADLDHLLASYGAYYAESEAVARSSISAAGRGRARRLERLLERNQSLRTQVADARRDLRRLEDRGWRTELVQSLPHGLRERVPARVRTRVKTWLTEGPRRGA